MIKRAEKLHFFYGGDKAATLESSDSSFSLLSSLNELLELKKRTAYINYPSSLLDLLVYARVFDQILLRRRFVFFIFPILLRFQWMIMLVIFDQTRQGSAHIFDSSHFVADRRLFGSSRISVQILDPKMQSLKDRTARFVGLNRTFG